MTAAAAAARRPIADYLRIPDGGEPPYLEGQRCRECSAVFLEGHMACPNCSARGALEPVRLSNEGRLHVYSIVFRSFPGLPVPYVSAVVDLDGGGTVKGTLIGVEPRPGAIEMGMPVDVVYEVAPQQDREGHEYLTYYFKPRQQ